MAKKRKEAVVSEALRRAVRDSGQTWYRIAKDSGVNYGTLHKFMTGTRQGLSLAAVDKLAAYFGMRLVKEP